MIKIITIGIKYFFILGIVCTILSCKKDDNNIVSPQSSRDVSGTWSGSYFTNLTKLTTATLQLTQSGTDVSGTMSLGNDVTGTLKGTISNNTINCSYAETSTNCSNSFNCTAIVVSDTIKFTLTGSDCQGSNIVGKGSFTKDKLPVVLTTSPANNDTSIAENSIITATFSQPMDPSTITKSTFILKDDNGDSINGDITYSENISTFVPLADLLNGKVYTVVLTTGIKSLAGKALANNYEWKFTTIAKITGENESTPKVPELLSPTDNASSQSLTLTLSWKASDDATSYTLQVSTTSSFSSYFYNQNVSSTSQQINGLSNSTTYYWRVIANNSLGSSSPSVARSFITVGTSSGFSGDFLAWTGSSETQPENLQFKLVRIKGQTGEVTVIGGQDFFTALAYGPDGTLYGIGSELCIIDPATGSSTSIGTFNYGAKNFILMRSAAFSRDGALYVVGSTVDSIFTVDLKTAELNYVGRGPQSPDYVWGIEFDQSGTLYGAAFDLYTMNSSNAAIIKKIGSTGIFVGSMTLGGDGVLYGMDNYPSKNLYSLSLNTGNAASVVPLSSDGISCLVAERSITSLSKLESIKQINAPARYKSIEELKTLEEVNKKLLRKRQLNN